MAMKEAMGVPRRPLGAMGCFGCSQPERVAKAPESHCNTLLAGVRCLTQEGQHGGTEIGLAPRRPSSLGLSPMDGEGRGR